MKQNWVSPLFASLTQWFASLITVDFANAHSHSLRSFEESSLRSRSLTRSARERVFEYVYTMQGIIVVGDELSIYIYFIIPKSMYKNMWCQFIKKLYIISKTKKKIEKIFHSTKQNWRKNIHKKENINTKNWDWYWCKILINLMFSWYGGTFTSLWINFS